MKKILIAFLFMMICENALAVPCDFITNNDIRYLCKAIEEKSSSQCQFINDNDFKYGCLAEVSKQSSYCDFIRDNDLKYLCKVRSKL